MIRETDPSHSFDLTRNQVLKMATREIGGKTHLFIESGGFGPKNPPGWKPTFLVFQQQ